VFSTYKFTGKERDAESGLDYFGARYYASNMGRWMSPDWSANRVSGHPPEWVPTGYTTGAWGKALVAHIPQ
jgi:RHS repeat-associated protein